MKRKSDKVRLSRNGKIAILSVITTSILIGGISGIKSLTSLPAPVAAVDEMATTELIIEEIPEKVEETVKPMDSVVEEPKKAEIEGEIEETPAQEVKEIAMTSEGMKYRMTYYATNDGYGTGSVTSSGKSTKDFQINERGWYTYQGKLVVATASTRLGSTNQRTYKLYDELTITIQGQDYDAVVLDVCGACMKSQKIDLFVSDTKYGYDGQVTVIQK